MLLVVVVAVVTPLGLDALVVGFDRGGADESPVSTRTGVFVAVSVSFPRFDVGSIGFV